MNKSAVLILLLIIIAPAVVSGCSQPTLENSPAPEFTLTGLDGKTVTLSSLYGRPVLLNFWASWCGPCRSEMPYLQQIHDDNAWRARSLLVLGVNLQEPAATVSEFMSANKYTFIVLLDSRGEAGRRYNVSSIPATYIIGKDGIIKDSRVGAFISKAHIEQMLISALGKE